MRCLDEFNPSLVARRQYPHPRCGDRLSLDIKSQDPPASAHRPRKKNGIVTISRCGIDHQVSWPNDGGNLTVCLNGWTLDKLTHSAQSATAPADGQARSETMPQSRTRLGLGGCFFPGATGAGFCNRFTSKSKVSSRAGFPSISHPQGIRMPSAISRALR